MARAMAGRRKRRTKIAGQFAPRLVEMLGSWAFRALSLSGHRVLHRLEIELGRHGGNDNGSLPCTYDDFEEYGIDRHSIAPAIREVEALGFVEITERGSAGNAEYRMPNLFRITYRHTDYGNPTDDWRKIETKEQAAIIAKAARQSTMPSGRSPVGRNTNFNGGNPHRNGRFHTGETPTTVHTGETPTTLDISGRDAVAGVRVPVTRPARARQARKRRANGK